MKYKTYFLLFLVTSADKYHNRQREYTRVMILCGYTFRWN